MKTFPNHFSLRSLLGYRARQHPKREDAFQQLVGDGLREERPGEVSVAPTKGADGSIDAFVELGDSAARYLRLPSPLIVECKDHDDELADVTRNVREGWAKMVQKLRRKAEQGWPDTYAPWRRAKGYLYCVSAVLPSQAARDQLQGEVEAFFSDLARRGYCAIESVRIMDWSDLRAWLDRMPRVADHWLGVGLPGLLPQEEFVRRLSGFQQYLLEEHLPFVAPEAGTQTHPEVLWQRLQGLAGTRGALLVGPGGVGKSRTLMETAKQASRADWRVLHALPGERSLTIDALAEEVLVGDRPTLLLLDYLDQMPNFDLEVFRRRLLPASQARGIPIALLASARPGYLRRPVAGREELLGEPLFLRPGASHRHAITQQVVGRVAPTAVGLIGLDSVRHICGGRPILALFIAFELERHARLGQLTSVLEEDLRSGDLVSWLRRRLKEDALTVPVPDSPFELAEPKPMVIAAALALAAAPQREEALVSAITTALQQVHASTPDAMARQAGHLIRSLELLGWLERDGMALAPAHDVVVEEVLEEVLREQQTEVVRGDVLSIILSAGRNSPRTLGRLTTSLGRLISQEPDAVHFERELLRAVVQWFDRHASELGRALLLVPADEASYALGAVVAGVAGGDVLTRHWEQVLQPWLDRSGLLYEARHLLYRSLKLLPPGHLAHGALCQTALRWLEAHGREAEASYVLGALLSRDDLGTSATACVGHAERWLETHVLRVDARYVLHVLLSRGDLGEAAPACIAYAVRWLDAHGQQLDATYVLEALLRREDLKGAASECLGHAVRWLEGHGQSVDARFVLWALLEREDLKDAASACIGYAACWLEVHGQSTDARYVLSALLERQDLKEAASACIGYTVRWLEAHGQQLDATYILGALLERQDLTKEASACIGHAERWLAVHGQSSDARYVLRALLVREDLKEEAPACIGYTVHWLEVHGQSSDAQFVLRKLLEREDLKEEAPACIGYAMRWLEAHGQISDAQFVLRKLLEREDLKEAASACIGHAERWLEAHGRALDATYILGALLGRRDLKEAAFACIGHTVHWLEVHGQSTDAQFVLRTLLERRDLKEEASACIGHAMRWLEAHGQGSNATYVLVALLERRDLKEAASACIGHAMRWLEAHGQSTDAQFVVKTLLEREYLKEEAPACVRYTVRWLEAHGRSADARYVLRALLVRKDLKEEASACVGYAMRWLEAHGQGSNATYVLVALLERRDLKGAASACIGHAMRWLEAHGQSTDARYVLSALLERQDLKEAASACMGHAVRWLEAHGQGAGAASLLETLLSRNDLGPRATACLDFAARWLEVHGQDSDAPRVLAPLLLRSDRGGSSQLHIECARRWLQAREQDANARYVLSTLLARSDLRDAAQECIQHAMRWLALHGKSIDARFVLRSLLSRKDLAEFTSASIEHALLWLEHYGMAQEASFVLQPLLHRHDLGALAARCGDYGVQWLELHGLAKDASFVLQAMLTNRADVGTKIAGMVLVWLSNHPKHPWAPNLVDGLLNHRQLPAPAWRQAAELALEYLRQGTMPIYPGRFLELLLRRAHLLGEHRAELEGRALAWARAQPPTNQAAMLIFKRLQSSASKQARSPTRKKG